MATKIVQKCAKWVCNSEECIVINNSPKQLTKNYWKKGHESPPCMFSTTPNKNNMAILITVIYNITKNLSSPLVHDDNSCI